jgi:hypothetical protein
VPKLGSYQYLGEYGLVSGNGGGFNKLLIPLGQIQYSSKSPLGIRFCALTKEQVSRSKIKTGLLPDKKSGLNFLIVCFSLFSN